MEPSPRPLDPPALAGLAGHEPAALASRATPRERFESLLPRVIQRVLGRGQEADQALQTGGFLLNDAVVVMRLNEDTDLLEFFCDIGQPAPHAELANYRAALEMNLCRTYPEVMFGVHPQSGRMVATTAMHMLLVVDDEVCLRALEMLTRVSRQLRADGVFQVTD